MRLFILVRVLHALFVTILIGFLPLVHAWQRWVLGSTLIEWLGYLCLNVAATVELHRLYSYSLVILIGDWFCIFSYTFGASLSLLLYPWF